MKPEDWFEWLFPPPVPLKVGRPVLRFVFEFGRLCHRVGYFQGFISGVLLVTVFYLALSNRRRS